MCIAVNRMGLFYSIYAIASNLLFQLAIDAKAISMDLIKLELFPLAQAVFLSHLTNKWNLTFISIAAQE